MGFLTSAIGNLLSPSPSSDYWYNPVARSGAAGVPVDETTALRYSPVWCATRILSEGVAGLPLIDYRRLRSGGKERATDQLLYSILHDEPNPEMDAFQFFDQGVAWLVNSGNFRSEIQRNGAGLPVALHPIHPSRIRLRRELDGSLTYLVRNDGGKPDTPIPSKDMLDICGPLSDDGITGKGVVTQAREAIGMGIATERYGANFFANSANPSGVVTHPGRLKPEAEAHMRSSWKKLYGGSANAGEIAILQEGVKYEKISFSPEDAQFLTTRQFNITEIARWYRVPPHMLYELSRSTNNNIEFQGGEFVTYSLMPWLKRIEKAITRKLIPKEQRGEYFVEFLVDALLRGDAVSRANARQTQFMNSVINADEWRESENMNPLPNGQGQTYYRPQNLTPVTGPQAPGEDAPPLLVDGNAEPTPETDEAKPMKTQDDAASKADIQATALNGAQIGGMVQVSQLTVEETFNQEAARGMFSAAFPLLSPEQINAIVDNLTPSKKPPEPAPQPFGGGPPKPDAPPEDEPVDDEEPEAEKPPGLAFMYYQHPDGTREAVDITRPPLSIADEAKLMHRIEIREARHAAKHPRQFHDWLDSFFAKHQLKVAAAFHLAGDDAIPLAVAHCEKAKAELLEASGVVASELDATLQSLGERWAK